MEKIFGIDLGTTYSEIAYVKDGKPAVVSVENAMKFLPSVVGVDPSGKVVTGFTARNQYAAFPENTVVSIKRKMGSAETVFMAGKPYAPAEISSEILKTLKRAAECETGLVVSRAVITVPAYFTDLQRKDTILAGELAGLEVVRIINEPTAAALAYGCREDHREKILVYDLGGGTFDISLVDIEAGVIEVLASDGDTRLGGDDFDQLLLEYFISLLPEGAVQPEDRRARARLKNIAETTKIRLSTEAMVEVREEFVGMTEGSPVHLETAVSRAEFESLVEEKLSKTFRLVDQVLAAAKIRRSDVAKVLLVGGSTYIPKTFNTLSSELGFDVHREVDPTFCVAMGAAIQGAIISGEEIDTVLVDVNAHSLGIRCLGISPTGKPSYDVYSIVIHRNTPIPASMTNTYYTAFDDQESVIIEAFQGEEPEASKNTPIGSFIMEKLPKKLPAGSEVDVTFAYNLNGTVEISAGERTSGKRQEMKVDVNRLEPARETAERPLAIETLERMVGGRGSSGEHGS